MDIGPITGELGSAPATDLLAVIYDIDDNDAIDFGDFAFFTPAFSQSTGGAEPPYTWWADFDKTNFVDFGDFSYFAPNFGLTKPDNAIIFPPNFPAAWPFAAEAAPGLEEAESVLINVELVAVASPTLWDELAAIPDSLTQVSANDTYFVEVWVQDASTPGVGVTGGQLDLSYATSEADAVALNHGGLFTVLPTGSLNDPIGLVDDFGGATFLGGVGVEPNWARLGYVEFFAASGEYIEFQLSSGDLPFSRFGAGNVPWADVVLNDLVLNAPQITARRIFYNNSSFDGNDPAANATDDNAIAPDKQALLPGETAAFVNYTSYTRGVNGIMVHVQGLANPAGIEAADFLFRVGNDDAPGGWPAAPAPTSVSVRAGAGDGGSDRVTIIFADNAIVNQWLQVTVLANADTGLVQNHVFYAGNLIGDTNGDFVVNIGDMYAVYLAMGPGAAVNNPADIDRNGVVNVADMYAVYLNLNSTLRQFTAPAAILESIDSVFDENLSWAIELMWLDELYGTSADSEEEEDDRLEATAADGVSTMCDRHMWADSR